MQDTVIFLIGFMGSGKSTFGRKLAKGLGYAFIDMDTYIEERAGKSIPKIFAEDGEEHFRDLETQAIAALSNQVHCVIATGGGAPCYNDNMVCMNTIGTTVYLQLSPEKLAQRLRLDTIERPVIAGKRDKELVSFIATKLKEREIYYLQAKHTGDADKPEDLISILR